MSHTKKLNGEAIDTDRVLEAKAEQEAEASETGGLHLAGRSVNSQPVHIHNHIPPASGSRSGPSAPTIYGFIGLCVVLLTAILGWWSTYQRLMFRVEMLEKDNVALMEDQRKLGNPDQIWTEVHALKAYNVLAQKWFAAHHVELK